MKAERSLPSASARLEQRGGRPSSWSLSLNGAAAHRPRVFLFGQAEPGVGSSAECDRGGRAALERRL